MTRAVALARSVAADRRFAIEAILRTAVVSGCGLALVLAGQPLPL